MDSTLPDLPAHYYRTEAVFRGLGGASVDHLIGCGFLLKPGNTGQHRGSVNVNFSGVLVLRGSGSYGDWHGRTHPTFPGCFFQRLPGRRHSTTHPPSADWAECWVNFGAPLCKVMGDLGLLDLERPVLNPGLSLALVSRFDRLLGDLRVAPEHELPRLHLRVQELVMDIYALDRMRRQPDAEARIVEQAARALSENLSRRISLPQLARDLGVGYERLRKLFRHRTGLSLGEYRIQRRIERARELLAGGDLNVKEVAARLGYPNPFVFSRQVHKVLGLAPSRILRLR